MTDVGNDFYVVPFTREDDYDTVLFGGPWLLRDHYLTMQHWYPKFCAEEATFDKIVAWVQFLSLPLYVCDKNILARLGNQIGRTLLMDEFTFGVSCGKFARVSVELDLKKLLISKFIFDDKVHRVEYEALHIICFECGVFGHKKKNKIVHLKLLLLMTT